MEINSSADFVRLTRAALAASGFVRREVGGMVYWIHDVIPSGARDLGGRGANDEPFAPPTQVPRSARDDRAIILIHGANDQAGTWCTVAPALARTRQVIIPDLPGHGESAPKDGPLPLSSILTQLETVIDTAASNQPVILVGNSLGGWLALLYALKHPTQIARLVLEASGGLARPLASPIVANTREEAIPILRAVHGPHYQPQEWVIEALLQRAQGSPMLRLTELAEHDIESRLGEIDIPSTLVWGADDGVLPLSYAEALRDAIPNAELHVIEGAAHIPHMQRPERFLQCLTAIC